MSTEKRPRGRPCGSGKNDTPYLAQVADLIVREPSLRATTAMKRVMQTRKDWGASDETLLRRWQEKWKAGAPAFLAAAQDRARPEPQLTLRQRLQGVHSPELQRMAESIMAWQRQPEILRLAEATREWDQRLKETLSCPEIKRFAEQMAESQRTVLRFIDQFAVEQKRFDQLFESARRSMSVLVL